MLECVAETIIFHFTVSNLVEVFMINFVTIIDSVITSVVINDLSKIVVLEPYEIKVDIDTLASVSEDRLAQHSCTPKMFAHMEQTFKPLLGVTAMETVHSE